ncbi:TPA: hypothetical protein DDX46_00775 [Candidatus Saccharibacteria bacterium]|nr:MAG: hypothetical protein UW38_C0001G0866 [Candidatus Saccharibacteria bacterium GW2011_GWC2_44_17]OGL33497.1 MAG: hypothetical protein A3E20_01775 [Candidatus Saccharibacteria bacterium RIFCSPHIGHO2_12_FULL_47_16]HBH77266.1 hypothetical protein [Candidatus Saccharibacteria bacterium]
MIDQFFDDNLANVREHLVDLITNLCGRIRRQEDKKCMNELFTTYGHYGSGNIMRHERVEAPKAKVFYVVSIDEQAGKIYTRRAIWGPVPRTYTVGDPEMTDLEQWSLEGLAELSMWLVMKYP